MGKDEKSAEALLEQKLVIFFLNTQWHLFHQLQSNMNSAPMDYGVGYHSTMMQALEEYNYKLKSFNRKNCP